MLTQQEIHDIEMLGNYGKAQPLVKRLVAEIKAQRAVVIAALHCTGEDGHDGMTGLNVAAEEYLEVLGDADPRWRTKAIYENIDRIEAEPK